MKTYKCPSTDPVGKQIQQTSKRTDLSTLQEHNDSILLEAYEVVHERRDNYGGPQENFERIARLWSAILGEEITTTQVGLMMVAVKMARHCHRPKRDNLVDIAGYADCIAVIEQENDCADVETTE